LDLNFRRQNEFHRHEEDLISGKKKAVEFYTKRKEVF